MVFSKEKAYRFIGFDDRLTRYIGIPLVGLIISIIFFEEGDIIPFTIAACISALYTLVYWEVNRSLVIYFRARYRQFNQIWKRLILQVFVCTLISSLIGGALHFIFHVLLGSQVSKTHSLDLFSGLLTGIICTYVILTLYECIYFFQRWKASVIETERLKAEKLFTELESLKNQVNPHFLFNSLNALTAIIPESPQRSIDFVQHLSLVYRYVLEVNASKLITLSEELSFIDSYLYLLSQRHGEKLLVDIQIPERFMYTRIVPMSLQILIENAVKHNIVSEKEPLQVSIFVRENVLYVQNDLQRKRNKMPASGFGLNNIKSRYQLLCNEEISIVQTEERFEVALPLIMHPEPIPQL